MFKGHYTIRLIMNLMWIYMIIIVLFWLLSYFYDAGDKPSVELSFTSVFLDSGIYFTVHGGIPCLCIVADLTGHLCLGRLY